MRCLSPSEREDRSRLSYYVGRVMASGDPHVLPAVCEATVTLQDVALLLGLPIDGRVVTFPPCHD